jgi:hypothetical protein
VSHEESVTSGKVSPFPGAHFRYPGAMTSRAELPIPDYDHLPEGSLVHRIRTLDADALRTLLEYERSHAHRLQALQAMEHRLAALRDGAEPSGGDPAAAQPEHAPPAAASGPGDPDATPDNNQPLRHGVAGQTPNRELRSR